MPTAIAPPHWDLTPFFPGIDSPEFLLAFSKFQEKIAGAERMWDAEGITSSKGTVEENQVIQALDTLNELFKDATLISAYLECLVTTNSKDAISAARASENDALNARVSKLHTRFALWIGGIDLSKWISKPGPLADHAFALQRLQRRAKHLMEPRLEALVSDLRLSGSTAWSKLHSNVTSQLLASVDGETLPMASVRNLATHADRSVRRTAYLAELKTWKEREVTLAACLNGIKGEVNTLVQSRNWQSPLEEALFNANIDSDTLNAMMTAAQDSFPVFRRYLKAKAKLLGMEKLSFYDIFAPVAGGAKHWGYGDACEFVAANFYRFSNRMGEFASRTFQENWIDAEAREGKVGGAYCTPVRNEESRILMNYEPSYGSVSTLAHELGHAYHNLCLFGRTPIQSETPMTMAETASIFCETIVKEAALESAEDADKLDILEASLQGACQVVVDISSRFFFEESVFHKRSGRELSASEFCELMLDAQRRTYGDGLNEWEMHPYMWAAKPHYYSSYSFYNFPYMFGLLFGLGLYAIYRREPEAFRARYDDLLGSTGLADVATLAKGFDIDVRDVSFWRASLAQVERDVARLESLVY